MEIPIKLWRFNNKRKGFIICYDTDYCIFRKLMTWNWGMKYLWYFILNYILLFHDPKFPTELVTSPVTFPSMDLQYNFTPLRPLSSAIQLSGCSSSTYYDEWFLTHFQFHEIRLWNVHFKHINVIFRIILLLIISTL